MKRLILCADDYAQNEAISKGILDLVARERLTAVSCMTASSHWSEHGEWLHPYREQIEIGLHFDLTHFGNYALGELLQKSFTRRIKQTDIETELKKQLDAFEHIMGCTPDFIDGHQHIHNFPVIQPALLNVYEQRLKGSGCYIRSTSPSLIGSLRGNPAKLKALIIALSGGLTLKRRLRKRGIPHNQHFAGTYDFKDAKDYATLFPKFLKTVEKGGLIMCHPGLASEDPDDCIAASRVLEYEYFREQGGTL